MTDLIAQAQSLLGASAAAMLLVHLRLLGCVMALPGYGERAVPVRLRVALALALTPLYARLPTPPLPADAGGLLAAAAAELVTGLIFGLAVRLMSVMLSVAAAAIASSASLSQLIGGENEMAPHPIGNLMHLAGLALLMALGFPMMVADYLAAGFAAWPLGGVPQAVEVMPAMLGLIARGFALAMVLASPFILGGLLYQTLSGVIGRVMPALPVVFVGAPLAILLALTGLALFTVPLLGVWVDAVLDTPLLMSAP